MLGRKSSQMCTRPLLLARASSPAVVAAAAMSTMRVAAPPAAEKPLIFPCLYTKQKQKKKKTFSDGYLTIYVSKNLCSLYSARDDIGTVHNNIMMNNIDSKQDSKYLSAAELALFTQASRSSGEDVEMVFEGHLVQVTIDASSSSGSSSSGSSGGGAKIIATKLVAQPFRVPKFVPPKPIHTGGSSSDKGGGGGASHVASSSGIAAMGSVNKGSSTNPTAIVKGRYEVTADELDHLWDDESNDGATSHDNAATSLTSSGNDNDPLGLGLGECDIFSILQPVPLANKTHNSSNFEHDSNNSSTYRNNAANGSRLGCIGDTASKVPKPNPKPKAPLGIGMVSSKTSFFASGSQEQPEGLVGCSPAAKKAKTGGDCSVDLFSIGNAGTGRGENSKHINIFDSCLSIVDDKAIAIATFEDSDDVTYAQPLRYEPPAQAPSIEWDFF